MTEYLSREEITDRFDLQRTGITVWWGDADRLDECDSWQTFHLNEREQMYGTTPLVEIPNAGKQSFGYDEITDICARKWVEESGFIELGFVGEISYSAGGMHYVFMLDRIPAGDEVEGRYRWLDEIISTLDAAADYPLGYDDYSSEVEMECLGEDLEGWIVSDVALSLPEGVEDIYAEMDEGDFSEIVRDVVEWAQSDRDMCWHYEQASVVIPKDDFAEIVTEVARRIAA